MARRGSYREALAQAGLLRALHRFQPRVAGTFPLALDQPDSDIDVLCYAPDPDEVAAILWDGYRAQPEFALRRWRDGGRPLVASFAFAHWPIEIFAAAVPVTRQAGWRHFRVERRLLRLGGTPFRARVQAERTRGSKTEPAFARVLGLAGDPYAALLELASRRDQTLLDVLVRAGITGR